MTCPLLKSKSNKGFVTALVALAMFVLIGFVALAIDLGYAYLVKGQLQTAADAGALAGAGTIYPANSSPSPATFPPPNFADAQISANAFVKYNSAAGANLSDANIVSIETGYYNLERNPSGIQPQSTIPTGKCSSTGSMCNPVANSGCAATEECQFQDVPAVQVTVQKSVPTFFAKVFGIDAFPITATAVSVTGPAQSVKGLFPLAVSKCMVDNYFGPAHPVPLPEITVSGPYSAVAGCNTGEWTALTFCSNNGESTLIDLMNGTKRAPTLSIGDNICISTGVKEPGYKYIQDNLIGAIVELPVVANLTTNSSTPITGFVAFEIGGLTGSGANTKITGHFVSYYANINSTRPGGSAGNTVTPPVLVQ